MLDEALFFAPLTRIGELLRTRALSPVELAEGFLARIARVNARYNAYVTVTRDLALEQARDAEREIGAGRWRGPLHGVPWGAKDLLATRGIPTGWGTRFLADQVFDTDATAVAKLHAAGAVLLGKTHCVELAGCLGYRFANASVAGPGRNPWNPARWTGGSSSGSGAAVAAGLATFALGTETWGSILCPSAFCGLTGLRPTYGRVSRHGAMVGAYTFDKIGPMARSAADCRAILAAIAGPDPLDPSCATSPMPVGGEIPEPLAGLRAAVVPLDWTHAGEPESKRAFDAALPVLRAAGLALEEAALPDYPADAVASVLITAEALAAFEPFLRDGRARQLVDRLAPHAGSVGAAITGADVMKAWRMRRELQEVVAAFFGRWDVIVTPNFMSAAPPADADLNQALAYGDPVGAIGNACGLPALALPAGPGRDGMPVGLQVVGPPDSEPRLLAIGEAFQRATRHHEAHATVG